MRSKGIYIMVIAAVFAVSLAAGTTTFGQGHGRGHMGRSGVQIDRRDPRVPPIPYGERRTARKIVFQGHGHHRGWIHKKYSYGYRNYGQYRRTQVGHRRYRTLRRPSWADRVRRSL